MLLVHFTFVLVPIALYHLRIREQQNSFIATGHKFTTRAINFHNQNSRDDFIKFLDVIIHPISSKPATEDCRKSLAEMKSWLNKTHGSGELNPAIFPKLLWWDSTWYLNLLTTYSFAMFHGEDHRDLNLSSKECVTALLSSQSSSISLFTFTQLKRMVKSVNYFQHQCDHFFLMESPSPASELNRLEESIINRASKILDLYILHQDLFANQKPHSTICIDLSKAETQTNSNLDEVVSDELSGKSFPDNFKSRTENTQTLNHKRSRTQNKSIYCNDFQTDNTSGKAALTTKQQKRRKPKCPSHSSTLDIYDSNNCTHLGEKDQYYAPEEIDNIFVDNMNHTKIPRDDNYFISLDDVCINYLRDFGINLIFGKCELHTFKKLYKFGHIYDAITEEKVKNSPTTIEADSSFKLDLALHL